MGRRSEGDRGVEWLGGVSCSSLTTSKMHIFNFQLKEVKERVECFPSPHLSFQSSS